MGSKAIGYIKAPLEQKQELKDFGFHLGERCTNSWINCFVDGIKPILKLESAGYWDKGWIWCTEPTM